MTGPTIRPRELTVREVEVLQHLAHGRSNEETARALFLSVETIKTYVRHVLEKLDAKNRTHAVAIALRRGLIT